MIPIEVEHRIAKYFLHRYLPTEVMIKVEEKLLSTCIRTADEDLDHDELVSWAIEIIDRQLENNRLGKIIATRIDLYSSGLKFRTYWLDPPQTMAQKFAQPAQSIRNTHLILLYF